MEEEDASKGGWMDEGKEGGSKGKRQRGKKGTRGMEEENWNRLKTTVVLN